jgi:beta-barrel assembly-enhancing protease
MKRALFAITLSVACATASAQFDIGRLLDSAKQLTDVAKNANEATREIDQAEEIQIGDGLASGLLGAVALYPNDNLQRYVNRVGKWVAMHSERADLPWTFGVMDSEIVNAFALPGGVIFVSYGLVKRLNNESELAGVLAHEIAHVVKKHQLAAIQNAAGTGALGAIGQELLSQKLGRTGVGKVGLQNEVAAMGTNLVKDGFFLRPLDRSLEYEADRTGVVIATRAGYDPYGLVSVLQMMQGLKEEDAGLSIVFKTHPQPSDRIAELEKSMASLDRYASQPQVEARFRQVVAQPK